MASSVSHEMITPMRCIISIVHQLERRLQSEIETDPSVGKELDLVVKTA